LPVIAFGGFLGLGILYYYWSLKKQPKKSKQRATPPQTSTSTYSEEEFWEKLTIIPITDNTITCLQAGIEITGHEKEVMIKNVKDALVNEYRSNSITSIEAILPRTQTLWTSQYLVHRAENQEPLTICIAPNGTTMISEGPIPPPEQ
jgi:hypothetical protein